MTELRDRCHGKWRGLLPALGMPPDVINGKHQACPMCGGTDRFRFTDYKRNGEYFCSQCGTGDGFDLLMKSRGLDFKSIADEIEKIVGACKQDPAPKQRSTEDHRKARRELWTSSQCVSTSDPAGTYLRARCELREYPAALRYAQRIWHAESRTRIPAMLALVTAPGGDRARNQIHRTYLSQNGTKADVDPVRAMMPGSIARGSSVQLTPPAELLGIAEGIETALSATILTGIPCWSAINAELLKAWEPPAGTRRVVIFADNDANYTGQAAAYQLAHKLEIAGVRAEIRTPENEGWDWNDVHQSHRSPIAA